MTKPLTLITGGTRGIGAATARLLARQGHDLVLGFHRDLGAAEDIAGELSALGAAVSLAQVDLTTPTGAHDLFELAVTAGQITGVVNNAGATLHYGTLAQTPVETIREVLEINLIAPILVAREAVRVMSTEYGGVGGVIVNLSSGAATLGSAGSYVHYAAAKAGIDALTLGLGTEVAKQGIRVVAVAPGLIRTQIHADAGDPDRVESKSSTVPLGRAGEPMEVAEAIAWLMSDAASYVTGTTLRVAGGR